MSRLDHLFTDIRACTHCAEHLPLGPRPIVRGTASATLLIIGQAPGTKVHETGIPWNDPSGDRLRDWLKLDKTAFYDETRVAIMPMGFCYPGVMPSKNGRSGGDAPPRPECAPLWHDKMRALLPNVKLTLLVGSYAQKYYLGKRMKKTMTDTVRCFEDYLPDGYFPLPHPSWRNTAWMKKNPWFEERVLGVLIKNAS